MTPGDRKPQPISHETLNVVAVTLHGFVAAPFSAHVDVPVALPGLGNSWVVVIVPLRRDGLRARIYTVRNGNARTSAGVGKGAPRQADKGARTIHGERDHAEPASNLQPRAQDHAWTSGQ
jgi:hypothetical protein